MDRLTENKIVLVVRETRLEELKARFNTTSQARFYVQQLGGNFDDYEQEDAIYRSAIYDAVQVLSRQGRVQVLHRNFLANFLFGPNDLIVVIGQDGLVANTLKYLRDGQLLIAVNPDPERYDGQLLPFEVADLAKVVPESFRGDRQITEVTMAKASLNNGQVLYAVNDLFIGPKSHGSARYTIRLGEVQEKQSSSGVIVSTGLGSTGWFTSLITGARGIVDAYQGRGGEMPSKRKKRAQDDANGKAISSPRFSWSAEELLFTVREPFPSKTSQSNLVFGRIKQDQTLRISSNMPERGVIFSDGVENDFLEFNSGTTADIAIADRKGHLVQ